jgi:outer membrane protein TolC
MATIDTSMPRRWSLRRAGEAQASTPVDAKSGSARRRGLFAAAASMLLLTGCTPFSSDGGMSAVQIAAANELNKDVIKIDEANGAFAETQVRTLVAKPLTASSAVQIALLANRDLQAAYNGLGISEAQMVEASLPPPPSLAFRRLVGSGFEIEGQIVQNVLALLTLPRRRDIAEGRFRQAQARAVDATLRISAEAARAYYRTLAANEIVAFLLEARLSAEAISDVAKRLGETGAMSKLEQAREHAFYAEISGRVATARLRQRIERERLTRILGLWGLDAIFRLPDKLPRLPSQPRALPSVETEAVLHRVDLAIARMQIDVLAKELGLTRRTRFLNALEVTGLNKTEKDIKGGVAVDKFSRQGGQVDVEIPIYDFGESRVRAAEETYMRAVNRLLARAVGVRSEAREAYQVYRGTYDIARHYEREVIPLRQIISDETLLNYNAMISDLFALLTDARARILANVQAIEARRDFWIACVDLHTAIAGGRGQEADEMAASPGLASTANE